MNFTTEDRLSISKTLLEQGHSPDFIAGFIAGCEFGFDMMDKKLDEVK